MKGLDYRNICRAIFEVMTDLMDVPTASPKDVIDATSAIKGLIHDRIV